MRCNFPRLTAFVRSSVRSSIWLRSLSSRIFPLLCLGFLWGGIVLAVPGCTALEQAGLPIPGQTVSYEQQLADHLSTTGAVMYGAYWCPHCSDQKNMFKDAVTRLPYVECDPQGENPQPDLCRAKEIKGYPTWEIQGQLYPGTRSLEELATLSNYPTPPPVAPAQTQ